MIHGFFQMTAALDASRQLHNDLAQWLKERGIGGRSAEARASADVSHRHD
jgi:hypothetical protein